MLKTNSTNPTGKPAAPTLAMVLTAWEMGAIAVIAVSGPKADQVLAALGGSPATLATGQARRCDFSHAGTILDQGLLIRRGTTTWEMHLHGGLAVLEAVLRALAAAGATVVNSPFGAPPRASEFAPRRAGRVRKRPAERPPSGDLPPPELFGVKAAPAFFQETFAAVCQSASDFALDIFAGQLAAGLAAWADQWLETLATAEADSKTEERRRWLWRLQMETQWVLESLPATRYLLRPPRVVLCGPPNAGKSTLANALCGRPASITSAQAGTTRDWVNAAALLTADTICLPVELIDTAGLRETTERLEGESIRRALEQVRQADLVVLVLDGTVQDVPFPQAHGRSLSRQTNGSPGASSDPRDTNLTAILRWLHDDATCHPPLVLAINKSDLPQRFKPSPGLRWTSVAISALHGVGLDELNRCCLEALGLRALEMAMRDGTHTAESPVPPRPLVWSPRQRVALQQLALCPDVSTARHCLKELTSQPAAGSSGVPKYS